jgi:predicted dehydrogenase
MVLRLGLVGYGRWGRKIEQTLLSFPNLSVTVIARGEKPVIGLDGVLIATQSANHADAALPYLEAGVATFIEKPMATTVSDAGRMRDAARRSGAPVFVGHVYLHHPAFMSALEFLPSLGAIRYVLCEGMNNQPRTDSSVLWDWLPHHLSMARSVFACDPGSVAAWSLSDGSTPLAAVAKFHYGNAPLVSMISWLSLVPRMQMTIVCDNGTLLFDDKAAGRQLTLYDRQGEASNPLYPEELPLTREMSAFLNLIRSGKADSRQIEAGFANVCAIAAVQESIGLGGRALDILTLEPVDS